MKRNGKEICKIRIVDNSKDGEEIVTICENEIKCTNGYEVKIEYVVQEKCDK